MLIIGIAGGSGSGKSTVVKKIINRLPKKSVSVIYQDAYYKDNGHLSEEEKKRIKQALADPEADFVELEKNKIKGAIRTDFILSAEIIVISLGTVADKPFVTQLGVLVAIASLMTIGVYGLVAGIVKMDDAGLALTRKSSSAARALGNGILAFAPWFMRFLSIAGTAAMFLVGGGIVSHGIPALHHINEALIEGLDQPWETLMSMGWTAVVGMVLGLLVLSLVMLGKKIFGGKPNPGVQG